MSPGSEPDLAEVAARFAGLLHAAGATATAERAGRLAAAMALTAPATVGELYWLARVTLVADHADIEVFDRVFAQVFAGLVDPADFRGNTPPAESLARGTGRPPAGAPIQRHGSSLPPSLSAPADEPAEGGEGSQQETVAVALSADERLRRQDFAELTAQELARLRALTAQMALAPPPRRSRRSVRHGHGAELDVRATLRRARRTGGEPLRAVHRRRRMRPRRVVLVCDISGSMEAYARAYLQLLMSGVGGARAEAFVFATRLTRLTRALRNAASPDVALERAGRSAPDWSGGTRIGEALKTFNDEHGRRGVAHGAVVVILSDGWDCGDPALLGREMERLHRLAHRVVWVNPRKAAPGYSPLAGGMAAALPHVDAFVSGHSLAALDEVLEALDGN